MEYIRIACQILIALGIFNVWLLRFNKPTEYRGKGAPNMKEEFRAYGLPAWSVTVIGFTKVLLAILLLVGIWVQSLVNPAAIGMAILMVGAIAMHIKVKDNFKKALPASIMLLLSLIVIAI